MKEGFIIEKGKRTRAIPMTIRMTESEKELIDGKVKASGMSKTDYLIKALSDKPIVSVANGAEILSELKRQGNNLNQAVKNCYFDMITSKSFFPAWTYARKRTERYLKQSGERDAAVQRERK